LKTRINNPVLLSALIAALGWMLAGGFVAARGAASADLSLSVSTAPQYPQFYSNFVFTVTVSNAGPSTATGVVVSNQIPTENGLPSLNFISTSDGSAPTNGILLMNLGSLAAGATDSIQITGQITTNLYRFNGEPASAWFTNVFQVFADQTDPIPTNNTGAVVVSFHTGVTIYTASTWIIETNLTATVSQQATNYSTELIARLPNGTVVYDQTFSAAFSDPTVQAAVTLAAGDLTGAGATSYTGPTQTSFLQNLEGSSSDTVTNIIGTDTSFTTTLYIGPQTIMLGANQSEAFFLGAGRQDFDTLVTTVVTNLLTTTNTATYLNSAEYVMTGIVAQADLSLSVSNSWVPNPNTVNSIKTGNTGALPLATGGGGTGFMGYFITVSNAGPSAATGVVVSNRFPASFISGGVGFNFNFVSATGGATPTNGLLLVPLGSLAAGATDGIEVVMQIVTNGTYYPDVNGGLTNVFQVFADQTDPDLTNNSATVITAINTTTFTVSTENYETNLTATVNRQATNYSTELIARLPNGTVVYDQTFNVPYANGTVQSAITTAAGDLTGAGAASYTGPTETSLLQSLEGSSSVTVTNAIGTNFSSVTTLFIGPQTIMVGTNQSLPYSIVAGGVDYDTLVTSDVTNLVTTTNTSTYLNSAEYVMTGTVAQVDVALNVTAAPNPVAVGAPLTYSLTVTNNSSTTASGVVVSNTLPPGVTVFSLLPSQGAATNQSGIVTYSVGSLTNSHAATLAIVVVPNAAGVLTNTAIAFSAQTDSQPANNRVTNVTTAVSVPITNLVLTVLSSITLNPQTGLFEQRIEVSNGGPATPSSVLVLISGLPANARLYNATGTTNGTPFVQSASSLGVGSNVVFLLEYYVPTRVAPKNLTLTVEAGPVMIPPVASGTILNISRTIVLANGSVLVEFSATPGQVYAIQYSSDMVTWLTAVPAITAPANQVQWIDAGPPQTVSSPAQQGARYYRVVRLTAN
jgi:uncharacterized repeat protein (TIGR01451 family)